MLSTVYSAAITGVDGFTVTVECDVRKPEHQKKEGAFEIVGLPDAAVKEAKNLGIPVVAITDTNCDPDPIDYVIPGNDDAIRAVKLIASIIADAVIEANQGEDAVKHDVEDGEVVSMDAIDEVVAPSEEA